MRLLPALGLSSLCLLSAVSCRNDSPSSNPTPSGPNNGLGAAAQWQVPPPQNSLPANQIGAASHKLLSTLSKDMDNSFDKFSSRSAARLGDASDDDGHDGEGSIPLTPKDCDQAIGNLRGMYKKALSSSQKTAKTVSDPRFSQDPRVKSETPDPGYGLKYSFASDLDKGVVQLGATDTTMHLQFEVSGEMEEQMPSFPRNDPKAPAVSEKLSIQEKMQNFVDMNKKWIQTDGTFSVKSETHHGNTTTTHAEKGEIHNSILGGDLPTLEQSAKIQVTQNQTVFDVVDRLTVKLVDENTMTITSEGTMTSEKSSATPWKFSYKLVRDGQTCKVDAVTGNFPNDPTGTSPTPSASPRPTQAPTANPSPTGMPSPQPTVSTEPAPLPSPTWPAFPKK